MFHSSFFFPSLFDFKISGRRSCVRREVSGSVQLLGFTVAILAQGTSWAVAATQAFFPYLVVKDNAFLALGSSERTLRKGRTFLPPEIGFSVAVPRHITT